MTNNAFRIRKCALSGVHAVEACSTHSIPRHTHDQFGIGLIRSGAQRSMSGRGMVEAGPGMVITVEPGLWAPAGVTLSWQWKYWNGSQMVAIPGATSPTYTPTADMAGKRPVAYITGTAPGYAPATVTWGVNEVNGTAPTMTGTGWGLSSLRM